MPLYRTGLAIMIMLAVAFPFLSCGANSGSDGAAGAAGTDGEAGVPGPAGEDGSVAGSAPQSPSGLTAEAISPSRIDVRWVFNTGSELGFNVQRSEGDDEWETIAGTSANVTVYHDESVECEHEYSYRVLAYNDYGESQPSNEESATADYCELDAPSDVTAILDDEQEDGSQRSILLSWSEGAGELPGVPNSYEIYRKTFDGSWSGTPLATQPSDQTTYTDEDAECGGTYQYRVRAANENDVKSAFSNTATSRADACPLVDPSNLVATTDLGGKIEITWDINDPDATGYLLQRRDHEARAEWLTIVDLPEGSTNYSDEGAECETADYDYRLRAYNGDKQSAWIETLTPGSAWCVVNAPSGLLAEAADDTSMQLTWTDNSDNESGFNIYRDTLLIHTTEADAQTYVDEGRVCETDYEYYVEAFNANVTSEPSNTDRDSTSWCPVDAPTGLTASTTQVGHVLLNWADNSNEEMGYYIQRSEIGLDTWRTIATLPSDSSSFQDTTATCETMTYDYRAQAYDQNTVSSWSNIASGSSYCAVTSPTGLYAQVQGTTDVSLTWQDNSDNETGFRVYRDDTELTTVAASVTSYADSGLTCENIYRYEVTAFSANVESDPSGTATAAMDYCPVSAPQNLTATGSGTDRVDLAWDDMSDNETNFDIRRRETGETIWDTLATVSANTEIYSDMTVECLHNYEYQAIAYNDNVESDPSNTDEGTPSGCTPERPQPVLSDSSPQSYLAFSHESEEPYTLEISGEGITEGAQLIVGDYIMSCDTSGQGINCEADENGDPVAGTCATQCTVTLPDELMMHADEYVVRLKNPDPVFGGQNESAEFTYLNVVAPLPEITKIWPWGVMQLFDEQGSPIAQEFTIHVWGLNMMANAQFRLGPNSADIWDDGIVVSNPDTGEQYLEVQVSTQNLFPRDEPYSFTVINPSPGGGERNKSFGVNPRVDEWSDKETTYLGSTRALGPNSLVWHRFSSPREVLTTGVGWSSYWGWAAVRNFEGELLTRVKSGNAGGAVPLPLIGETWIDLQTINDFGFFETIFDRASLHRGSGTFGDVTSFAMVNGTASIFVSDINGDGASDLVVADSYNDIVSIRLGEGNGNFDAVSSYHMGDNPISVYVSDVNGDGKPDVITADSKSDTISIRLGAGDGSLGPKASLPMGNEACCVFISDLNGDGASDLITSDRAENAVSVRFGIGDGSFGSRTSLPMGDGPVSVFVTDLNGDGVPDLTTADRDSDTVSIRLGCGDGSFEDYNSLSMGDAPYSVFGSDLNGDGTSDLITADGGSNTISIRLGVGDGSFGILTSLTMGDFPISVFASDLNGDSAPDIITADFDSHAVSIRMGNGDGTFSERTILPMGSAPSSVFVSDANGDGAPDLVTADRNSDTVSIRFNADGESFGAITSLSVGNAPYSVFVSDVNSDSTPDLITADRYSHAVSIYLGNGDGAFGDANSLPMGDEPMSIYVSDLNGDVAPDLVTADSESDTVSIRLGVGDGTFNTITSLPMGDGPWSVFVSDVNNDYESDLITADRYSNSVSIRLGIGDGTFGTRTSLPMGDDPYSVYVSDLNCDGSPDLITADSESDTVSIRLGVGDGSFGSLTSQPMGVKPFSVVVSDVNGDSAPDLITADNGSGTASVRLGVGDGSFGTLTSLLMGDGAYSVFVTDVNGDGAPDLTTANHKGDTVSIRLGNGDGTFGVLTSLSMGDGPTSIYISDMNGDGAVDLITSDYFGDSISIRFLGILGTWHQELTDSFSDDPDQPWLPKYAEVGFTDLDIHQAAQTVTKVGVRVLLEWTTQPAGTVELGLIAPDGQMVDLGSHSDFTAWPDDENPTSWRLNKTFREYDFGEELGIAGLVDLHGLQPTDYWTLSIDNQSGASAEVKSFTVITDGSF